MQGAALTGPLTDGEDLVELRVKLGIVVCGYDHLVRLASADVRALAMGEAVRGGHDDEQIAFAERADAVDVR